MPEAAVIPAPPATQGALQGTVSAQGAIARVKFSHDAMIDMIIANPTMTQNALAAAFGYSVPWVSRIYNSDAFQMRLAERKEELIDPSIRFTMDEKLRAAADKSLEVIMDRLSTTKDANLAVKALELSTKALGYGARPDKVNIQQNNYVVALPDKMQDADAWAAKYANTSLAGGGLTAPLPANQEVVDVESKIQAA